MDNDLKEILKDSKGLTTAQTRTLYDQINTLKSNIAKLQYKARQARDDGNDKDFHYLSKEASKLKNNKNDFTAKVKGKINVEFQNKTITVDKDYLQRLKDPKKYLEKLHIRTTETQIKKSIKKGDKKQAASLIKLMNLAYTDKRDLTKIKKQLTTLKSKRTDDAKFFDFLDKYLVEAKKKYLALMTAKGNTLKVNYR